MVLTGDKVAPPPPQRIGAADLSGIRVLAVEDQMLIAMDLEQILSDHGVIEVTAAASATEGLEKLRNFAPDIAVLDINLGDETSAPIAEELTRRGIPFAFATGYGDRAIIPPQFRSVPIVRKPYEAASMVRQLSLLLKRE